MQIIALRHVQLTRRYTSLVKYHQYRKFGLSAGNMGKVKIIAAAVAFAVVFLTILLVWRIMKRRQIKARETANAHTNPAPNAL